MTDSFRMGQIKEGVVGSREFYRQDLQACKRRSRIHFQIHFLIRIQIHLQIHYIRAGRVLKAKSNVTDPLDFL